MVSSGMRDVGYTYLNINDTWQGKRDEQGFIHGNERFLDMRRRTLRDLHVRHF
jgi:alpha-galactosidase